MELESKNIIKTTDESSALARSACTAGYAAGKAHQRLIRETKATDLHAQLFDPKPSEVDIKRAQLREIDYHTAKKIIQEYEWLGTMGTTQYHFGIYFDGFLAGVVCFGYFQAMNGYKNYVGQEYYKRGIQLSRGACVWWAHEHSGSKLIAYGLREMQKRGFKYVIAFSDMRAGEIGTLYQATNWYYLGTEKNKRRHISLYYRKTGKPFMDNRDFCKKYGYKNLDKFLEQHTHIIGKAEPNKARYIKLIGNKRENDEMLKKLGGLILQYPKRPAA